MLWGCDEQTASPVASLECVWLARVPEQRGSEGFAQSILCSARCEDGTDKGYENGDCNNDCNDKNDDNKNNNSCISNSNNSNVNDDEDEHRAPGFPTIQHSIK